MTALTRRRFLFISAACSLSGPALASDARWNGAALGAAASLRLVGLSDTDAAPIINAVESEMARLEEIFSLYRPDSQICKLNRYGTLSAPAPELLRVLGLCAALHQASEGAFDPSVQPLWSAMSTQPPSENLDEVRQLIGWEKVFFDTSVVRLPVPGQSALTLNGIAQGAITDRIAALLRGFGLRDVLVNMGEVAALGTRSDGTPWNVGIAAPDQRVLKRISLQNRAVATSSSLGSELGPGLGHIITPNGPARDNRTVSISAPDASLADGLSTALCAAPYRQANEIARQFPGARIELDA
ncbi:FAD:protein FMN transferase [Ruegeria sp. HKCCD4332]|uniref:FAD:protein FMN transferase n=1 Tax=Ruegeria sp. HKCCD4332 TaxID=2683021 RepID=UPI0014910200|nr:FAD:protein FMN transferase [Ruegeria sp. HKCCD4332]NOD76936.1 FAD:protein FMN transferase [Ruegeria sp. HKCCD4332]